MAIARVNYSAAGTTDGTTVSTPSADFSTADLLLALISFRRDSGTGVPTKADDSSNSYDSDGNSAIGVTAAELAHVLAPTVDASMSLSITTDGVALRWPAAALLGFSGIAAVDVGNGAAANNAQSVLALPSITPSVNGCLLVTVLSIDRVVTAMTLTGGGLTWTIESVIAADANNNGLYVGWAVQTTAAAIVATWDWTTNAVRSARIQAFTPAAAATKAFPSYHRSARFFTRRF